MTEPEVVAYHEAGHALVAWQLGGRVHCVTIDPDRDDGPAREGGTEIRWRRSEGERELARKLVRVSLAGPVAEMLYTGDPYHPGMVAEWSADWQAAWESAGLLWAEQRERLASLERVSLELYRHLNAEMQWAALAALADNLLAHDTLEREEIEEILRDWL
jgi:ATP-dependent Zn protease